MLELIDLLSNNVLNKSICINLKHEDIKYKKNM